MVRVNPQGNRKNMGRDKEKVTKAWSDSEVRGLINQPLITKRKRRPKPKHEFDSPITFPPVLGSKGHYQYEKWGCTLGDEEE